MTWSLVTWPWSDVLLEKQLRDAAAAEVMTKMQPSGSLGMYEDELDVKSNKRRKNLDPDEKVKQRCVNQWWCYDMFVSKYSI